MARVSPLIRAAARRGGGNRSTRMEMKMMLSMPRTISRSDSARKASQRCGSAIRALALRYGR
jgi:hypothetical protein